MSEKKLHKKMLTKHVLIGKSAFDSGRKKNQTEKIKMSGCLIFNCGPS